MPWAPFNFRIRLKETLDPVACQEAMASELPLKAVAAGIREVRLPAYLEVLKPRETALLTFLSLGAAFVATGGQPGLFTLALAVVVVLLGSAACNGLTNYLDREVDARMKRTCYRALPAGRISPPEKALPLMLGLLLVALGLAWYLHPLAFVSGVVGTFTSVVGRKMSITHLLGAISGCAPVWVTWFAFNPTPNATLLALSLLIAFWIPLHVWSLMTAYRDDYLRAGVRMWPLTWPQRRAALLLFSLAIALYITSQGLFLVSSFRWLYLIAANVLGGAMLYASYRLLRQGPGEASWKVYKLSAYPYLGLIFLAMILDLWLL